MSQDICQVSFDFSKNYIDSVAKHNNILFKKLSKMSRSSCQISNATKHSSNDLVKVLEEHCFMILS